MSEKEQTLTEQAEQSQESGEQEESFDVSELFIDVENIPPELQEKLARRLADVLGQLFNE